MFSTERRLTEVDGSTTMILPSGDTSRGWPLLGWVKVQPFAVAATTNGR